MIAWKMRKGRVGEPTQYGGRQEGGGYKDRVSWILQSLVSQGIMGEPWRVLSRGLI